MKHFIVVAFGIAAALCIGLTIAVLTDSKKGPADDFADSFLYFVGIGLSVIFCIGTVIAYELWW